MIIYSGSIAQGYYTVPQVAEAEPEILPRIFIYTGIAMIFVAYIGFYASKSENEKALLAYIVFNVLLLANFIIFTMLLNYSSQVL